MKKFVVFMFLAVGMLMTSLPSVAQNDVKLTMEFKNEPLSNVLLRLEQSSFYKFLFSYSDVEKEIVNGSVKDAKFMDIVGYVLKGKSLKYTVDGKFITITRTTGAQKSHDRDIRTVGGYVYFADTKEPVMGAQLRL